MLITKDVYGNISTKITPNSIREVLSILIIAKRLNGVPTYKNLIYYHYLPPKKGVNGTCTNDEYYNRAEG
jgi:hypothetical protein